MFDDGIDHGMFAFIDSCIAYKNSYYHLCDF